MVHPELDKLMKALMPFAQDFLGRYGEFNPFAAVMSTSGEISHIFWGGFPPPLPSGGYFPMRATRKISHTVVQPNNERPSAHEVRDTLIADLRERRKRNDLRAAGICHVARTIPPGQAEEMDAICVHLERSDGDVVNAFLPYTKVWLGRYKFGNSFETNAKGEIFLPPESVA